MSSFSEFPMGKAGIIKFLSFAGVNDPKRKLDRMESCDELPASDNGNTTAHLVQHLQRFFKERLDERWGVTKPVDVPSSGNIGKNKEEKHQRPMIIGLTGKRRIGKSVIAEHLKNNHGFISVHPFAAGKELLKGYYQERGASPADSVRMVDGDLKDTPLDILPVNQDTGVHYTSRHLMEHLGNYMGNVMGTDWTLGVCLRHELDKTESPDPRIIIESVVYEADTIRKFNGSVIVKVWADAPNSQVDGFLTDKSVDAITPDVSFKNEMNGVESMIASFDELMLDYGLNYGQSKDINEELGL